MSLPAAAVVGDVLWTKASTGWTDEKGQICLQTQTSCRLGTGMGDDRGGSIYIDAQAGNQEYQSVSTCSGVARRGRCNRVPRT